MSGTYYPEMGEDGEGKPTLVFEWIHALYWNLQRLLTSRTDAFVGADIPIYADSSNLDNALRPGVFVACNRPKGHRRGYRVWEEADRFPDVVILVISDHWRFSTLQWTIGEYERFGVSELYLFNPFIPMFVDGWHRSGEKLVPISIAGRDDFTSPILGVRVVMSDGFVEFFSPNGERWVSPTGMSLPKPFVNLE